MSLDERKRKILGAVVRDYVETVRPVGSEDLAQRHAWGVKSATIRNELAELSEMGYLRQPHTSAGRIPSDRGYRFYVDHLMVAVPLLSDDDADAHTLSGLELDYLLRRTCALLTQHTAYTSIATPPRSSDTTVSRVFVSAAGAGRFLLAVLLSTGQVENRLLAVTPPLSPVHIERLANALNAVFADKALDAAATANAAPAAPPALQAALHGQFDAMAEAVRQMLCHLTDENNAYLEGESEILRQPEFRDGAKIDGLLGALQHRTLLFQTLSRALLGPSVAIVIGAENNIAAMHECSVVSAPYFVGARERGTIGVVGPTRMDYDRAVPAVEFFARSLTHTLTSLGHS